MEKLEGYIEHIVFRNEENGYTVLSMISEGEEITCVGSFPYISEGERLQASGSYTEHQIYGRQFQVETFELKSPEDVMSIEKYLGSGAVKGIGAALAARIVRRFGEDTFRIMEEEPERLAEVKGISERKAQEIAAQVVDKHDMRNAMIFLQKYGISTNLAVKIYGHYGQELYRIIQENPYRMADELAGVGFKIADEIAARVGIQSNSDYRIRSGILYVLMQAAAEGHTYLPEPVLLNRTGELLRVEITHIEKFIMDLCMDKKLIVKEKDGVRNVYAAQYYYLELNVAAMLHDLNVNCEISYEKISERLEKIEEVAHIELDEMQRMAVIEAVKNGLLVITGGPGTGKTTTINAMIKFFETEGLEIRLAAPTGRAAKRMTEATGYEAQTIHRMLELAYVPDDDDGRINFERNEQNPLEADVIMIDEMSMVDISLMNALLKAVTVGTRLIMVGDVNQLPSVGPGSVLKDIIESHCCNVVRLTKIFRQASMSDIVVNAHKINAGEQVVLNNKSKDFYFLKREDANVIAQSIIYLVDKKLPPYVEARPYDIQVLTPMRKGSLGVEQLNKTLQQALNPPGPNKREKEYGDHIYREGDKVMQIKNNYQLEWEVRGRYGITADKGTGVFNGDMGVIKEINLFAELLTVEFDEGRCVEYSFKQLEELELAYAITIHKAQGSEYPAVVIPLLTGPRMLLNRNLLYTAVTRARRCVTIIGSETTFRAMVENESEQSRYSGLRDRIREVSQQHI